MIFLYPMGHKNVQRGRGVGEWEMRQNLLEKLQYPYFLEIYYSNKIYNTNASK
jgi:hypothetical protein